MCHPTLPPSHSCLWPCPSSRSPSMHGDKLTDGPGWGDTPVFHQPKRPDVTLQLIDLPTHGRLNPLDIPTTCLQRDFWVCTRLFKLHYTYHHTHAILRGTSLPLGLSSLHTRRCRRFPLVVPRRSTELPNAVRSSIISWPSRLQLYWIHHTVWRMLPDVLQVFTIRCGQHIDV